MPDGVAVLEQERQVLLARVIAQQRVLGLDTEEGRLNQLLAAQLGAVREGSLLDQLVVLSPE